MLAFARLELGYKLNETMPRTEGKKKITVYHLNSSRSQSTLWLLVS